MYKHVYVYTNMYTYTHTHPRVTDLFSRNAKIAAAVTGTITSESHANTRSHTANTYWFGFILIFFLFSPQITSKSHAIPTIDFQGRTRSRTHSNTVVLGGPGDGKGCHRPFFESLQLCLRNCGAVRAPLRQETRRGRRDVGGWGRYPHCRYPSFSFSVSNSFFGSICTK